jgi:hypothetical protein
MSADVGRLSACALALATSCSPSTPPKSSTPVKSTLPQPAPPSLSRPSPPPQAASCPTCCDESINVVEVDPASTLGFQPYACWLKLDGRYANTVAYANPPPAILDLFCREGADEALRIIYTGAPVGTSAITDLVDPYHTGGREPANTVSYSLGAPTNGRYRFDGGEIRFQRPPRAVIDASPAPGDGRGAYVELGVDLRFEGDRRFRAALRICPTYARQGPVSDPIR